MKKFNLTQKILVTWKGFNCLHWVPQWFGHFHTTNYEGRFLWQTYLIGPIEINISVDDFAALEAIKRKLA